MNIFKSTPDSVIRTEPSMPSVVRPVNPPIRRMSDIAAQAAQNLIDLEHERDQLQAELMSARSHINVLEESNNILKEEVNKLDEINHKLRMRNTEIMTRIQIASRTILDIAEFTDPTPSSPPRQSVTSAEFADLLKDTDPKENLDA